MAYIIYNVDSISTGVSRNLKDIPVEVLSTGDRAHLKNGNEFSVFVFNSVSVDDEDLVNFPRKIHPADFSSSGVWEEIIPSKNYIDEIEASLSSDISSKENSFTKNSAFNKNFGTGSSNVPRGNDSRFSKTNISDLASNEVRGFVAEAVTNISTLTQGKLVSLSGGNWVIASNANTNYPVSGLCYNITGSPATDADILLSGFYRVPSGSFTPGILYLGIDGDFTQTKPTASGSIIQELGVAITADTIYFNPSGYTTIELS